MKVGFQGESGAYSEDAVARLFPEAEAVGYPTFDAAFDGLEQGAVAAAVLPVENTLGGIVQEVSDLLWDRTRTRVAGELSLPIQHCLLGRGEPVTRALSHPQALQQCRRYLEANGIRPVPYHDTAAAARVVSEGMVTGNGAIASAVAAKRYGLKVIAAGIQDSDANQTRFLVVELGSPAEPGPPGLTKASLAFTTGADRPGGLAGALMCFADRGVNLTRLDSRPLPGQAFRYRFYADIDVTDPVASAAALAALREMVAEVRLFGTYRAPGPGGHLGR